MMQAGSLITTENICLHFGEDVVLHDINFAVQEREIVTVLGPNGSGKSTFLRILIGALKPTAGTVNHRPDLRIGYVPQRLSVDANMPMSVDRFLRLARGGSKQTREKWVNQVGVGELLRLQVSNLSGGQLQRVMLTQALLANPHVLILDEATQGLDQSGEASFYRLIEQVRNEQGCAIVLVSHDLHVVMSASDRVVCLNGHVCCEGAPTIVSAAPEYRALFGLGTEGALALYRHDHDHSHDDPVESYKHDHSHDNPLESHKHDHSHDDPLESYKHDHSHDDPVESYKHDHSHDDPLESYKHDHSHDDPVESYKHDHSHDDPLESHDHDHSHDDPLESRKHDSGSHNHKH